MPARKDDFELTGQGADAPPGDDRLINRRELAAKIGCSVSEIENLKDSGLIPYLKIRGMVRYDWAKVRAALCNKCERGQPLAFESSRGPEMGHIGDQLVRLEQKVEKLTGLLERSLHLQQKTPKRIEPQP